MLNRIKNTIEKVGCPRDETNYTELITFLLGSVYYEP